MADLDAILDEALDEFEEQDLNEKANATQQEDEHTNIIKDPEYVRRQELEQMRKLMAEMDNPIYGKTLQDTLRNLSATSEGNESVENLFATIEGSFDNHFQPSFVPSGPDDVEGIAGADRTVAATMQMLADAQNGMQGFEAGKMEEVGETMMEEMMAQFQALGDREDYNEVIDGVMRQLLSRDLMYDPIKQICEKFPEWLALHREHLRKDEYENYGKMYQTFQKILAIYDTEPDNFPRLMELMFDMQQYGQPPADIIKDLAPGLKFDENGMPIMPNMGAGMMPGGEGLPNMAELSGQMATGKCSIM